MLHVGNSIGLCGSWFVEFNTFNVRFIWWWVCTVCDVVGAVAVEKDFIIVVFVVIIEVTLVVIIIIGCGDRSCVT